MINVSEARRMKNLEFELGGLKISSPTGCEGTERRSDQCKNGQPGAQASDDNWRDTAELKT